MSDRDYNPYNRGYSGKKITPSNEGYSGSKSKKVSTLPKIKSAITKPDNKDK